MNKSTGPGRPAYAPKFPRSMKWTLEDFCEANGVNPNTGKGKLCSKLTLTKFLNRDMFHSFETGKNAGKPNRAKPRRNSVVILLDETQEPDSKSGLGRKRHVFMLRANATAKNTAAPVAKPVKTKIVAKSNGLKKAAKSNVSITMDDSKPRVIVNDDKSITITEPPVATPIPAASTPEPVTEAPVAPAPTPAPEPVTAPVAETAPVAATAEELVNG